MENNKQLLNAVFAVVVIGLAAVAIGSYVSSKDQTVILKSAAPDVAGNASLPENHPPLDAVRNLAALEQLSRENPQNADYRTQLGNTYYDMGSYQKAVEAYQESLRLRPHDPNVETDLATCFHYLGQHDKALDLLEAVLRRRPDFNQALFNKGIILQVGKNDPNGAIGAWEKLLQVDPDHPLRSELEKRILELKSVAK
jgi:cytochrome c-type biogenesis protein CcmH/NrfG